MAVRLPILDTGKLHARLDELLANGPRGVAWAEPLILSDDIQAFVIVHPPGTPNDTHYHEHDEWWVVMRGEINWHIEGQSEPIRARAGDFVLCPGRGRLARAGPPLALRLLGVFFTSPR